MTATLSTRTTLPETLVTEQHSTNKEWRASLNLAFAKRVDKSVLVSSQHCGPLRVQRAFYPEGGVPHVYILHPPGGLVAGDVLAINADVAEEAHGLVTTPSAGRVYRTNCAGLTQHQTMKASIKSGALLEWLPQENIIFNGANGINHSQFDLSEGARLIAWDISCLGRPAGDFFFDKGQFVQSLQVTQQGKPLLTERIVVKGGSELLNSVVGFNRFTVFATFIATIREDALLKKIKSTLQYEGKDYCLAFTQQRNLLVGRYLGHQAIQARQLFTEVWCIVRPFIAGVNASEPRIWHT